jgi:arabinoxylan arabinofuranohydrolase
LKNGVFANMKKQGFNPCLPSWEYIPDGEPYLFNGRVYVYGSHDKFNGYAYCLNDYVCWSAPEDDLSDWCYEGVIYLKTSDPFNKDESMCLYAPDVTLGPDGRYYLFYVLDKVDVVSVAVCDSPAGEYKFHGYVRYPGGTMLGRREGDQPQFDPGVLTEGEKTYLYTGFCGYDTNTRIGATAVTLGPDMLTVLDEPVLIAPGVHNSKSTSFEGHEFFEASSIRKRGDTYYFIYSSIAGNELCYATSKNPLKDFIYGGVIVSNADMHIGTYKPAEKPMNCGGNNHGSIIEIKDKWYIFYHRHTNGNEFSRQGCLEPIEIRADGSIPQVEMTSCGPNGGPLDGKGEYPAYIACNIFSVENNNQLSERQWPQHNIYLPKITQDGQDGDEETGFVTNILNNYGIGFKYFDCKGIKRIKIKTRGYNSGTFHVKTKWDGESLACIKIDYSNIWTEYASDINLPDGIHALYFIYKGTGCATISSFALE